MHKRRRSLSERWRHEETRLARGKARGLRVEAEILAVIRKARVTAGVSQRSMGAALGWSQAEYWRFENALVDITFRAVAQVAAILGLELSASLYAAGEPLLDRGHLELLKRFRKLCSAAFRIASEVVLPKPGDPRAWDLVLRLGDLVIGVEAETRVRDMQAFVRRIHQREVDGGVDVILVVLSASAFNRSLAADLRLALGERYATPPRALLRALRAGVPLPGSGVILI